MDRIYFVFCSLIYCFLLITTTASEAKVLLKTESIPVDDGYDIASIDNIFVQSPVLCMNRCVANDKCITFFYNSATGQCILHQTYLKFIKGSAASTVWKYYLTRDATGRCPPDYLYYRNLDMCYDTFWTDPVSFVDIKSGCTSLGGKLSAITSQNKHDYFKIILADRVDPLVCIGGTKLINGTWILEDGTQLTYFDWFPGQPGGQNETCLVMSTNDQLDDVACAFSGACEYVCEF